MSDQKKKLLPDGKQDAGGTATLEPKQKGKVQTKPPLPGLLPMYRVLLHNDDKNTFEHVIISIVELTPLEPQDAAERALEADESGVSLLLVTHKERAELYVEQFQSKSLTVSIEPAE